VPGRSRVKLFPDGLSSVWDASYDPSQYGCVMGFPQDGFMGPDVAGAAVVAAAAEEDQPWP